MALDVGRRQLRQKVLVARDEGRPLPSIVIVGAGLSGLALAIQLVRSGVRSFTIVEQSDGVGGTWRDNSYPGSGCDVPSHLYSFSFAPKTDWTRRFAEQPEILSYADQCVRRYRLTPHLRLQTTVQEATLDETTGRWRLGLASVTGSEVLEADTVVFACGQLNRPHIPRLDGLDRFTGPMWHSARWDHRCDLAGRRVAVIGNGASAIQFVPAVADECAELNVYQRSPNYVAPKKDRAYSPSTRRLFESVAVVQRAYRWWIYWGLESRWLWFRKDSRAGGLLRRVFAKSLRQNVVSPRLPESAVVPDYPVGCKRILISSDWYQALARPHVSVVTEPIDHVEPDAIVTTAGDRRATDVIIFGTGFETTDFLAHIPVTGEAGHNLAEEWEEGAHAYLGVAVPRFPNLYLLYGPNTNLGHNSILFMVERQINFILQALAVQVQAEPVGAAGVGTLARVAVTLDAYRRDDARTQKLMASTTWVSNCTSWYKTESGRVTNNWPTWTVRYWRDTLRLRSADIAVEPDMARKPLPTPGDADAPSSLVRD